MELIVERTYYPNGTNGKLLVNQQPICHTIELPWKNNQQNISCIPEGTYPLCRRYSEKFGWHLQVQNVPGRDLILLHPANNALLELEGCIAPVTQITGEGRGIKSRAAFEYIMALVLDAIDKKEPITITMIAADPAIHNRTAADNTNELLCI